MSLELDAPSSSKSAATVGTPELKERARFSKAINGGALVIARPIGALEADTFVAAWPVGV